MSRFSKFANEQSNGGNSQLRPTMNLRCVVDSVTKAQTIQQQVEYVNEKGQVIDTEWLDIPIIYKTGE